MVTTEKYSVRHHAAQSVTNIRDHPRITTDEREFFFLSLFRSLSFFFFASTPFKKFGSDCLIPGTALYHNLRIKISKNIVVILAWLALVC